MAQIRITDIKGSTVKIYNASKGEGLVIIKSGDLPTGAYTYSLIINNKKIDFPANGNFKIESLYCSNCSVFRRSFL